MMAGEKKPPRLPVQLTRAMPAAAAAPPRKEVGRAQNIGMEVTTPTTAMFMPMAARSGLLAPWVHSAKPTAEMRCAGEDDVPAAFAGAVKRMAAGEDHCKMRASEVGDDGSAGRSGRSR